MYSELLFKSTLLLELLIKDAPSLEVAGISFYEIDDFAVKVSAFRQLPHEIDLVNVKKTVERSLGASRIELTVTLRKFESNARFAWGTTRSMYSAFNNPKMNSMKPIELINFARSVRVAADQYLYELVDFGMTKSRIIALQNKIDNYFVALKNMGRVAKYCDSIRKISEIKMKELNLMNKTFARSAYDLWVDSSELKAQDYEIFIDKKINLTP
jgi:hypothetical protein